MYFYPLLIGVASLISPFVAVMILFAYIARNAVPAIQSPIRTLALFFVVPLAMLVVDSSLSSRMLAMDAVIAVGGVVLVFISMLKTNRSTNDAFLVSCLLLIIYGLLRYLLFGTYQNQVFDESMQLLSSQFPQLSDSAMLGETMPVWKAVLPAFWIISQSLAMVIGYILFLRLIGLPFTPGNLRFNGLYNLLLIAIIPLYLVEQTKMLFVNALLALCVIPLLQGVSLCWQWLGNVLANRIALGIFMLILILYANVLLVLLGFADLWRNIRKEHHGGSPA